MLDAISVANPWDDGFGVPCCEGAVFGAALGAFDGAGLDGPLEEAPPAGTGGRGAETPATLDPSPSFCNESASNLPVDSSPFSD